MGGGVAADVDGLHAWRRPHPCATRLCPQQPSSSPCSWRASLVCPTAFMPHHHDHTRTHYSPPASNATLTSVFPRIRDFSTTPREERDANILQHHLTVHGVANRASQGPCSAPCLQTEANPGSLHSGCSSPRSSTVLHVTLQRHVALSSMDLGAGCLHHAAFAPECRGVPSRAGRGGWNSRQRGARAHLAPIAKGAGRRRSH